MYFNFPFGYRHTNNHIVAFVFKEYNFSLNRLENTRWVFLAKSQIAEVAAKEPGCNGHNEFVLVAGAKVEESRFAG